MSLALLFHYLLFNMFRMLVHPSSGACDLLWIYFMCCIILVRCVLVLRCGSAGVVWYPYAGWSSKTSDIKLVYLYSTVKMMHGPINIRFIKFMFNCTWYKFLQAVLFYGTFLHVGLVLNILFLCPQKVQEHFYVFDQEQKGSIVYLLQTHLIHWSNIIRQH